MTDARTRQADALVEGLQREASGKLTVFLGAAPGVGKTYTMLTRAQEQLRRGVDLVIGLVETHGRADTQALLEGLPQLPLKEVAYHGHTLQEMDLDAVLARHPALVLVDELAHRNAPGSRHERRWQDVMELLDAGIDVWTTVNIQHLESLNDVVMRITGVRVSETVPDGVLDRLHDIVLVDLPPRELIARLQQGKVYVPEQATQALQAFFSPANLTALRELAMQEAADRVDSSLRETRAARGEGNRQCRRRQDQQHDDEAGNDDRARHRRKPPEPEPMIVEDRRRHVVAQGRAEAGDIRRSAGLELQDDQPRHRKLDEVQPRSEPGFEQLVRLGLGHGADALDAVESPCHCHRPGDILVEVAVRVRADLDGHLVGNSAAPLV